MPIDNRFSKEAFIAESERDLSSRSLANALELEVQDEIHSVVLPKIVDIIRRLNTMGHNLKEFTPPEPGNISFRDETKYGESVCSLRLALDTIVSAGFGDATDEMAKIDSQ